MNKYKFGFEATMRTEKEDIISVKKTDTGISLRITGFEGDSTVELTIPEAGRLIYLLNTMSPEGIELE